MAVNPDFEPFLTDTVDRLRATAAEDAYGNSDLDWSAPDTATFPARTGPQARGVRDPSSENLNGRDAVSTDLMLWLATDDITALDRVRYNGNVYEVTGEPENRSGLDGEYHHTKAFLRRVAG